MAVAHSNLGLALKDRGELATAIQEYRQAIALDPKYAQAHGALGLALLAQGEFAAAQQATQRCLQLLRPGHPIRGRVQKQLQLCQQALQLEQRVHALLQRQVQPSGPAELLQLAQFCRRYKHYPAAARLFTVAFAAEPELAEHLAQGYRYRAATAAALALSHPRQGKGLLSDELTASDQAQLRRQALDWLRADLKRLTQSLTNYQAITRQRNRPPASPLEKLIRPGGPGNPTSQRDLTALLLVCDQLQRWPTDPDLLSLREDRKIAELPAAEQNDWRRLWEEVRTLEKLARTYFTERTLAGNLTGQQKEQRHELKLSAGKTYAFDFKSKNLDAELRLEDEHGKQLGEAKGKALFFFTPPTDGTYRLIAASFPQRGGGAYVLRVREFLLEQTGR
jgi:hypothetical protein